MVRIMDLSVSLECSPSEPLPVKAEYFEADWARVVAILED